jgi:hypothetical protein
VKRLQREVARSSSLLVNIPQEQIAQLVVDKTAPHVHRKAMFNNYRYVTVDISADVL